MFMVCIEVTSRCKAQRVKRSDYMFILQKGNVDYLRGKVCNGKTITWVKIIGTAPH